MSARDSAALTRFLATLLFEIAPTDTIIFSALATLLAGVAVLACLAPALRATRLSIRWLRCGMNEEAMRKTLLRQSTGRSSKSSLGRG